MSDEDDKVTIEGISSPHRRERVERAKYEAMREALLAVLPDKPPGKAIVEPALPGLYDCFVCERDEQAVCTHSGTRHSSLRRRGAGISSDGHLRPR